MRPLVCFLAAVCAAPAATAVYSSSFDGSSSGWTAIHGAATADGAVTHANNKSLRLEASNSSDASARSNPISLTIGKRYELSGWVRTEDLTVRDLDRSPIATGAALTHGVHAVRRALRVAGRHARLDAPVAAVSSPAARRTRSC